MSTVEEELRAATRQRGRRRTEEDARYWHRLACACSRLGTSAWRRLSRPAQQWSNQANMAIKHRLPIPPPPVPRRQAPRGARPQGKKTSSRPRGEASNKIREVVCQHPTWDKQQVGEAVRSAGYEVSDGTITVVYYDAKSILSILARLGKLRE